MAVDTLLYEAVVAEKCGRYKEMVAVADKIAKGGELDRQERGIFTEAYRLAIGELRTASRLMDQICHHKEQRVEAAQVTRDYKRQIDREIEELCQRCLAVLKSMSSGSSTHHKVFLAKENADIHRYLAEIDPNKVKEAAHAYEDARVKSESLPSGDPLRLATLVNLAVFQYELERDHEGAIRTAERALSETQSHSDNREESVMRALIEKNLHMWARS
eukprot:Gregarina_sp_Pseudo_9__5519@NODE_71_length_4599_cov_21_528728_g65_i0_p5_GENE_NODE_71_length_4599_cov_21_528728_g65_i0NODE_71_length_4599_cov_21_528728_g65_i0_p5_ORF_typecomplete_len217_score64_501433/PF00244_20/1_7e33TPR_12/PF13424_6/7_3e03TPR_12/PF13424_6/4_5e03TPR_12/PF13424_6/0_037ANAPC5/PF12862_7/0_03TPR_MalT/PF17874_1/95TPR_MalT/PF17874_1/0_021TPR_19/PF14559_6/3_9e03TPR_19/PF14559_6/5_9e03TPR_19/PF14559_6/2_9e03TPR_19/PF14559_6/0_34DUF305/PF03713_13/1_9YtxC/PF08812_11/0_62YtxC/PF08812_11/4_